MSTLETVEDLVPTRVWAVRGERAAEHLLDLVEPALTLAGGYRREDVLQGLRERRYQGWVIEKGTARGGVVTKVNTYPTGEKVLHVWLLGGDDFMLWSKDIIDALTRFARESGCAQLSATVRPGLSRWLTRRLGWSKTADLVELPVR